MSRLRLSAFAVLLAAPARAGISRAPRPVDAWTPVRGVYRGFAPAHTAAYGELKLVVGRRDLSLRIATGLGVQRERIPLARFKPTGPAELGSTYEWSGVLGAFRDMLTGAAVIFRRDAAGATRGEILAAAGEGGATAAASPIFFAGSDLASASARREQRELVEGGIPGYVPSLSHRGLAPPGAR